MLEVEAVSLRIDSIAFRTRWMRTRFPFRFGIASMVEVPHVFAHVDACCDGQETRGLASDFLPPKWFSKDPDTSHARDLPGLTASLEHAADAARGLDAESPFAAWQRLRAAHEEWTRSEGVPALLAQFGTSLVERALIDAFCRAHGRSFGEALLGDELGVELGSVHPELEGSRCSDWLAPARPRTTVRHTVGLGDALEDSDLEPEEVVGDGLPQTLVDTIRTYGLTHFKLKVCGALDVELPRLVRIAEILEREAPEYRVTLDGNEQFSDVASFRADYDAYRGEQSLADGLLSDERLLFVEQALHRDTALDDAVGDALSGWREAPPMIIDESDASTASLRRAIELGYRGTSHKNCKGVFKGIANRCLIEWLRRSRNDGRPWIMSGEDLTNIGPIALVQDLAVMAALGIEHVERNGQHYLAGLSMFPTALQERVLEAHGDLYQTHQAGFAALRIEAGRLELSSILAAPFGSKLNIDDELLELLGEPGLPDAARLDD